MSYFENKHQTTENSSILLPDSNDKLAHMYSDVGVFKRGKRNLAMCVVRLGCLFSLFALPKAVFQLCFSCLSL